MKHTPGPWEAKTERNIRYQYVAESNGTRVICTVNHFGTDKSNDDAHLIAAAPELLEALRVMVAFAEANDMGDCACIPADYSVGIGESGPCEICQARAAIAKAEGK